MEDVFCQSLTVEVPGFGDTRVVPLREGGADIPVTGGGEGGGGGRWRWRLPACLSSCQLVGGVV